MEPGSAGSLRFPFHFRSRAAGAHAPAAKRGLHRARPWFKLPQWASARVRILVWIILPLVLAGVAALFVQRQVLLDRLNAEVKRELLQEVEEVRVLAAGRDPNTGSPFAGDVAAIFDTFLRRNIPLADETLLALVDGKPYRETPGPVSLGADEALVERWARLERTEQGNLSTEAGPVRYMAVPLSDRDGDGNRGVFVVANFMQREIAEINDVSRIAAFVWGTVVLGAIALGWFVAGRVLGPVRVVTQTARELTESDLSRRIAVSDGGDEISELARTFNVMLDRLEDAFRQQRQFLDDAGHELRTPLTIVRGHLELAGYDAADKRANQAVLRDELDRMGRIIDHLLLLARAEQPDFLQPEPMDLDLLTTEMATKARALADRDWQLVSMGHGMISADRHRLSQAIVNLLDNAARHTRAGDVIEIGSAVDDGVARIWVRDHGPGIPAEDRARIFDRFARGKLRTAQSGTAGLGLAIVRTIAQAHGGDVTLDCPSDGGARFTIQIPTETD